MTESLWDRIRVGHNDESTEGNKGDEDGNETAKYAKYAKAGEEVQTADYGQWLGSGKEVVKKMESKIWHGKSWGTAWIKQESPSHQELNFKRFRGLFRTVHSAF